MGFEYTHAKVGGGGRIRSKDVKLRRSGGPMNEYTAAAMEYHFVHIPHPSYPNTLPSARHHLPRIEIADETAAGGDSGRRMELTMWTRAVWADVGPHIRASTSRNILTRVPWRSFRRAAKMIENSPVPPQRLVLEFRRRWCR